MTKVRGEPGSSGATFSEQLAASIRARGDLNTVALSNLGRTVVSYNQVLDILDSGQRDSECSLILFAPTISAVCEYIKSISTPGPTIIIDEGTPADQIRHLMTRFSVNRVSGPVTALEAIDGIKTVDNQGWCSAYQPAQESSALDRSVLLMGTSGTTGNKKFVRLADFSLAANARDICWGLKLDAESKSLSVLPLSYSYGLSILHTMLFAGGHMIIDSASPLSHSFRTMLEDTEINHLPGVPSLYEIYEKTGLIDDPPQHLKMFTQAGGKLDPSKVKLFSKKLGHRNVDFRPMYGQTEATARMSIMPFGSAEEFPTSVGKSVLSGQFSIGSRNHSQEIVFRGPNVMLGYIEEAGAVSARDTQEGLLETGDLGEIKDGFLYITGRIKRIAKLAGVRIDLDEIEHAIGTSSEIAVVDGGTRFVIAHTERANLSREKIEDILSTLGLNRRLYTVVLVDQIPLTHSGKKNYHSLRETLE